MDRGIKKNKIEMHKEQLETYERHADDLASRKMHADRMFEFMKNQVRSTSERMAIETAQENSENNFQDCFREQVEEPTRDIKNELYKDVEEMENEQQNLENAARAAVGHGPNDGEVQKLREDLNRGKEEWSALTMDTRAIIGSNEQKVANTFNSILSRYK